MIASRIFAPEPAAASFRLGALARALAQRVDVTVLTVAPPPDANKEADGGPSGSQRGLRIRRWPVLRDATGYVRGYLPYLSFDVPLAVRLLLVERPDVVVVEPPPTTGAVVRVICALRRVPYVYNAADVWSDAAESTGSPAVVVGLVRRLEAWVLQGATAVLSVSDGVTDRVRELGAREVFTVGNGVDTEMFSPRGPAISPSGSDTSPDGTGTSPGGPEGREQFLLYAGTASEWQGAEIFAAAMPQVRAAVPNARLVFLGQGSSWPQLQRIADEQPAGAIELLPLVPASTSAAWLRGARAAVVSLKPGQGYDFAVPTKIFAALACGTPVLFAGPGPAGDLVREASLGWAEQYDPDAVARAMIQALRADPAQHAPQRLAAWVEQNRSLHAVAQLSAQAVLDAARR